MNSAPDQNQAVAAQKRGDRAACLTASGDQLRQPLHNKAVEGWKQYELQLRPSPRPIARPNGYAAGRASPRRKRSSHR